MACALATGVTQQKSSDPLQKALVTRLFMKDFYLSSRML